MASRVYPYWCPECDEPNDIVVEYELRDELQECPTCGCPDSERTWATMKVSVSTEKLSQSIPDVVAKGRFDKHRVQQELKKAKAHARETGDRETEKKIDAERKKL